MAFPAAHSGPILAEQSGLDRRSAAPRPPQREESFTPSVHQASLTACWGPVCRALTWVPSRPQAPAQSPSLWAGLASTEDEGWSLLQLLPPLTPKASLGCCEGFITNHAGQRVVTEGKKVGKWQEFKKSPRARAAGDLCPDSAAEMTEGSWPLAPLPLDRPQSAR